MTHADDWSWFDAPELNDVDLAGHEVTAVLVCRNAGAWLNATLAGLAQLDHRPDVIVAVDNGSDDDTRALLDDAAAAGMINDVVDGQATWSFGRAVSQVLSLVEPTEWVWLLHDDAIPDRQALTELLLLGARTPRLALALPLLVRPARRNHAARTLEIGASISGSGRRDLGLEPDEVAQGQYESAMVLGGSTCGALVKWSSLDQMGGFDPAISSYRDGVDLGWRAQLIDQWAITCPTARFVHRQAGRAEIRRGTIAAQAHRSEAAWDRLMGLRLVQAHANGLARLGSWIKLIVVGLLRAVGFLLGKAPDRASDEMRALSDFVFTSGRAVARLRRKIQRLSQNGDARLRVKSLRPSWGSTLESGWQSVVRWVQDTFGSNRDAEMTLDDLLGDEYSRRLNEGRRHIPVVVWVVVILAGLALMARQLYHGGVITAAGLLGAPATFGQAFTLALVAPAGGAGLPEPWLLICAVASVIFVHPTWFVIALLLIGFPATLLVAAWFAKYRIASARLRWLAAAGYALMPILMGALNRGSLWLVALAILLPFTVEWVQRVDTQWSGARSIQTMAGVAFSGVLILAILPVAWLMVMVIVVVRTVRAHSPAGAVRGLVAVLIPFAVWVWWLPSLWRAPVRVLTTPEPLLTASPEGWQMLFGRPVASGLPVLWVSIVVFGAIWLAAIIAAVSDDRARWLSITGGVGVAVGLWLSHLSLPLYANSVTPDPTPWLLFSFAALLLAGVRWMDDTMGAYESRDFGASQALLGVMSVVMTACLLIGVGWSAVFGMSDLVRGYSPAIPQYLAQAEIDRGTATLLIDAANRTWNIRSGGQTLWGQGLYPSGALAVTEVRDDIQVIVAEVLAGQSDEEAVPQLAAAGVSVVVVLAPVQATITALDATPGLQRTTADGDPQIWNVVASADNTPTLRAVLAADATVTYLTPSDTIATPSSQVLLLAQPPDPSLVVSVGGVELQPAASPDWRAGFALAGQTGDITIGHRFQQSWSVWVQLGVFVLLIIAIIPPIGQSGPSPTGPRRGVKGEEE